MNKSDFLKSKKSAVTQGGKPIRSVLQKVGNPGKPDAEKFIERVTITFTKAQFQNLEKNVGHDRNKTVVLRDILIKSGILEG